MNELRMINKTFEIELISVFSDDRISVSSEHTNYIRLSKIKEIDLKELQNKINRIKKFCKENIITLSRKNKYEQYIKNNKELYLNHLNIYNHSFEKLKGYYKRITDKGIFAPTCYDKRLNLCKTIEWNMEKLIYRLEENPLYVISCINSNINNIIRDIEEGEKNFIKITI